MPDDRRPADWKYPALLAFLLGGALVFVTLALPREDVRDWLASSRARPAPAPAADGSEVSEMPSEEERRLPAWATEKLLEPLSRPSPFEVTEAGGRKRVMSKKPVVLECDGFGFQDGRFRATGRVVVESAD